LVNITCQCHFQNLVNLGLFHSKDIIIIWTVLRGNKNSLHWCANMAWSVKGYEGPFKKNYVHFIGKEYRWLFSEFKQSLSCDGQLWQYERPFLGLVSFQVFCSSFCTTCFVLLAMGLGPKFLDFSSFRAPLCAFLRFQVWSFVWIWVLSFFFSCSLSSGCSHDTRSQWLCRVNKTLHLPNFQKSLKKF
jgi:hypothetical protein